MVTTTNTLRSARRASLVAGTALAVAMTAGLATPAAAQNTEQELRQLREQMNDMRERMQELQGQVNDVRETAPADRSVQPEYPVTLTVAGRVNSAVLYAEQENQDQAFVADNDGSGSRFEFLAETEFGEWTSGVEIVVSAEVNSTDEIKFGANQGNADELNDLGNFRQSHWFIENERIGYFSIGQGDTMSEDTGHVDLSNTAQAGAGSDVDDMAGGLEFVDANGQDLRVAGGGAPTDDDEVDDFFDALDGSRARRVIYKTPSFGGFSIGASLRNDGDELVPDVGIEYGATFQGFEVEAAAAWRENEDDESTFHGSASVMSPMGINLTFMGATSENDGTTDAGNSIEDPNAFFVKAGYQANFVEVGSTSFSIDYYTGRANDTFVAPSGALPEAESFGVSVLQEIEPLAAELYITGRQYDIEDVNALANDGTAGNSTAIGNPDEMLAVISGARVRF
ncbi:hypothetical protein SAMN05216241_11020 [Limimonas halophila]|uniref:Porin n=1 Tax=Limimonas halophila TaxID=1082479 RepID=A0A1G7TQE4_9PROT|nr:hypothetical protein [Limimonas halophila]SDG37184.1 hypothetical protein SAMN05216241_11020 [Limimonas halophila]